MLVACSGQGAEGLFFDPELTVDSGDIDLQYADSAPSDATVLDGSNVDAQVDAAGHDANQIDSAKGDAGLPHDATVDASDATADARADSSADAKSDASDAGSVRVWCGTVNGQSTYCSSPNICCATYLGVSHTYGCSTSAACILPTQVVLECDSPSDCGSGKVCCLKATRASCASDCQGGQEMCDPNSFSSQCQYNASCNESTVLEGFFVCKK